MKKYAKQIGELNKIVVVKVFNDVGVDTAFLNKRAVKKHLIKTLQERDDAWVEALGEDEIFTTDEVFSEDFSNQKLLRKSLTKEGKNQLRKEVKEKMEVT